jgi:hypothetical protein
MVLKRQIVAIQDVYVPVKRRQTLDTKKVAPWQRACWRKERKRPFSCGRMASGLSSLKGCIGWKPARHSGRQRSPLTWSKLASIDPCL